MAERLPSFVLAPAFARVVQRGSLAQFLRYHAVSFGITYVPRRGQVSPPPPVAGITEVSTRRAVLTRHDVRAKR